MCRKLEFARQSIGEDCRTSDCQLLVRNRRHTEYTEGWRFREVGDKPHSEVRGRKTRCRAKQDIPATPSELTDKSCDGIATNRIDDHIEFARRGFALFPAQYLLRPDSLKPREVGFRSNRSYMAAF